MNTVKEMILDEEKLVTYVSLSKELCIHINESKILLRKAVEEVRSKLPDIVLSVNYILSGITNDNNARIFVCPETEREVLRKSFKVILFEHIYSVNKGVSRVDIAAMLATNRFDDLVLCPGIIKNDICVKRTAGEIGTFKINCQEALVPKESPSNKSQVKIKKEGTLSSIKELQTIKVEVKDDKMKLEIKTNIDTKQSPKKSVANGKQKMHVKQKGIAGFFSKSNGFSKTQEVSAKEINHTKNLPLKDKTEEKCINTDFKAEKIVQDEYIEVMQENETNDLNRNNELMVKDGSQNIVKKNLKGDKKRKRVLKVSDSESEHDTDPFVEEQQDKNDSEDEIPPTPCISTVKITSGIINPKKKRKIVDKKYVDDDGFILTKKEEVYESCSENDEDVIPEKNISNVLKQKTEISPKEDKNSSKKISPPQTRKQVTIKNFFKKK